MIRYVHVINTTLLEDIPNDKGCAYHKILPYNNIHIIIVNKLSGLILTAFTCTYTYMYAPAPWYS